MMNPYRSLVMSNASAFLNQVTCGVGSPITSQGIVKVEPYSPSVSVRNGEKKVGGS